MNFIKRFVLFTLQYQMLQDWFKESHDVGVVTELEGAPADVWLTRRCWLTGDGVQVPGRDLHIAPSAGRVTLWQWVAGETQTGHTHCLLTLAILSHDKLPNQLDGFS